MNNNKPGAVQFLKELEAEALNILEDSENIALLTERRYKKYNDFLEMNEDIARSEAFRVLEKDIRTLYQTCKFISSDCADVRHSITDCGVGLN